MPLGESTPLQVRPLPTNDLALSQTIMCPFIKVGNILKCIGTMCLTVANVVNIVLDYDFFIPAAV